MRLKDADALVYELTEMVRHSTGEYKHGIDVARLVVLEAPTVDAAPIVRCRECKYFIQTVFFGNKMNACRRYGSSTILPTARLVTDDWFCADGERWDSENG